MNIGKAIGLEYGIPTRNAFGEELVAIGATNPNLVVVDGDVGNSTRTEPFGAAFPERFFNVGIAESNMVGVAAGLASCGHVALTASFAAFLTLRHQHPNLHHYYHCIVLYYHCIVLYYY